MNTPNFSFAPMQLSAEELEAKQRGVMLRVYAMMTFGLLVTAAVTFMVMLSDTLFFFVADTFMFFLIGELVLVIGLSWAMNRLPVWAAFGGFVLYAAINGATLALIIAMYTASSVLAAFTASACLFGAMTIVGFTTKVDLTKMGGFLLMGLFGIIIGSVVNMFLANSLFDWIITFVGILIFIGLTAYDTQRIKNMTMTALQSGDTAVEGRVGVFGALILYLDFINLFLRILRLFGKRR